MVLPMWQLITNLTDVGLLKVFQNLITTLSLIPRSYYNKKHIKESNAQVCYSSKPYFCLINHCNYEVINHRSDRCHRTTYQDEECGTKNNNKESKNVIYP